MAVVKGVASLKRILFPRNVKSTNGDFAIASFNVVSLEEGNVETHPDYKTFSMKGVMPPLNEGQEYYFIAEEGERHPTFGLGYEVSFMRKNISLDTSDAESVKSFLKIILSEKQVEALYSIHKNPIELIEAKNVSGIMQAKGIGLKFANKIIEEFEAQKDYSYAYIELGKFDLTPKVIRKITDFYKSPELAVEKVKENPYQLMDIDGYGFRKADEIYLSLGGEFTSEIRIKAFLTFALEEEASNGHTWITPTALIEKAVEFIPQVDKRLIGQVMLGNEKTFYFNDSKTKISLRHFHELEANLARELYRIINSENTFKYDGWEKEVEKIEAEQGWEFTEQQKEVMYQMLASNIFILQGYGGTGKTTTLKAVADILEKRGYQYVQTALSGKASQNLTLVTGRDGVTIHRLLKYNPANRAFEFDETQKLPFTIIIIDEISMVDAKLMLFLLKAVKDGAKVLMLGDSEQLESIGIPIMIPMIRSGLIPTMTLTEIHRQAQKSAVVTDSIAIREGKQIVEEDYGRVVHGELQDLEYELVENDDEIFTSALKEFYKHIQTEDIMDVQILTQVKSRGKSSCAKINNACQKIYNPQSPTKKEVAVGKFVKVTENGVETEVLDGYYLREGDKVINIKNNYNSIDDKGRPSPIFNGNIGIIEKIVKKDNDEYILINFEGIGRIVIDKSAFSSINLAYCITVHKSQGSSSKVVIVALPYHFKLNTRQLLYTAITRTREHCVVVSTKKTLVRAIKKNDVSKKRTNLSLYLKTISQEKEAS